METSALEGDLGVVVEAVVVVVGGGVGDLDEARGSDRVRKERLWEEGKKVGGKEEQEDRRGEGEERTRLRTERRTDDGLDSREASSGHNLDEVGNILAVWGPGGKDQGNWGEGDDEDKWGRDETQKRVCVSFGTATGSLLGLRVSDSSFGGGQILYGEAVLQTMLFEDEEDAPKAAVLTSSLA